MCYNFESVLLTSAALASAPAATFCSPICVQQPDVSSNSPQLRRLCSSGWAAPHWCCGWAARLHFRRTSLRRAVARRPPSHYPQPVAPQGPRSRLPPKRLATIYRTAEPLFGCLFRKTSPGRHQDGYTLKDPAEWLKLVVLIRCTMSLRFRGHGYVYVDVDGARARFCRTRDLVQAKVLHTAGSD